MTFKKETFTGNAYGLLAQDINEAAKIKSTILYFNKDDEETYLNTYQEKHPIDQLSEPLIMNRCIQFVYEDTKGGIDGIIEGMYKDNKCFVSEKITFDYSNFYTVEDRLKKYLLQLYVDSNETGYAPQFYGPSYVLITQYPFIRALKKDCSVLPKTLQWDSLLGEFSPKPIDNVTGCDKVKYDITNKAIRVEMYVILPAHGIIVKGNRRLVGPFTFKRWEDIRCNMRRLFAYNPGYAPGVYTVNPRSFDEKCQITCLNESDNAYKYACGARNDVNNVPYTSVVLGTRKIPTDNQEEKKHDYANLYLINPSRMNVLLNTPSDGGIMRDCITPEPIPEDFNTRYMCSTAQLLMNVPTTPQVTLKGIFRATFNISIIGENRCLVYRNNVLTIDTCGPEINKRWFVEPVTVTGENEPLYRLGTRVATRKFYLTKDANNAPIMTPTIPRDMVFKPRTDNQLMLMNILPDTNRLDWSNNEKFCLTVMGNQISYTPSSAQNKQFVYNPVSDGDIVCGTDITRDNYFRLVESAKESLQK